MCGPGTLIVRSNAGTTVLIDRGVIQIIQEVRSEPFVNQIFFCRVAFWGAGRFRVVRMKSVV